MPIILLVAEAQRRPDQLAMTDAGGTSVGSRSGLRRIALLLLALTLFQTSLVGIQRLVVLRMLAISPERATILTGLAFTLAGIATAGSVLVLGRTVRLVGYRSATVAALGLMTAVLFVAAATGSDLTLVGVIAMSGAATGIARPAIQAMLAIASPEARLSTVFGLVQLASAGSSLIGPLAGAMVAATANTSIALMSLAVFPISAGVLVLARSPNRRSPVRRLDDAEALPATAGGADGES